MFEFRAQVFTLEGILAGLVVLAGLVFALNAVVATPSGGGASDSPVDVDLVDSLLVQMAEEGTLKDAVLAGDADGYAPGGGAFVGRYPNNEFGRTLNDTLDSATAVNAVVYYRDGSGDIKSKQMIYNGAPGAGAIRSSTVVTIFDGDPSNFLGPKANDAGSFNVVEVEVVAW